MKCPACKLDNPETSKRCSKCGASMANVGTKSIKREPQPSISEGDCSWMIQFKSNGIVINGRCPACSSENIQKISVIVASGTSAAVTNSNSVGIASNFSESALIQSVGVSTTHTQTGLASALQAPQRLTPTQLMRGHYTGTVEKSLSGIVQHLEKADLRARRITSSLKVALKNSVCRFRLCGVW